MSGADTHRAVDAVWRIESPRLIGALTRMVRDLGTAEDLAHDALVAALEEWPRSGIPQNPGAWLMTTAKRRAIDLLRRRTLADRKQADIEHDASRRASAIASPEDLLDDDVGDDLLRLIFTACHPVLPKEARLALTLRLLGGLNTAEIARAFLVSEATMAQRIVRAKRTLTKARVPFEVPRGADRAGRLASVLEVIYLIFNEGYVATAGEKWVRPELCDEALRLGRVLAGLASDEPEVHGLVALMELQASRLRARVGPAGDPVLLLKQNRAHWDQLLIRRGLAALARAERLGGAPGEYTLQASIAACHARAATAAATDWGRIAALYTALVQLTGSPIVELNRAVAVGMAAGPEAGLTALDALAAEPALAQYPYLPAARGDLLEKLGRLAEARAEFERAAALTGNESERTSLMKRARACLQEPPAGHHGH